MGWFQILGIVLSFAFEIFKLWKEKNEELIKVKKEALKDGLDAIGESDISKLNIAIQRLR